MFIARGRKMILQMRICDDRGDSGVVLGENWLRRKNIEVIMFIVC